MKNSLLLIGSVFLFASCATIFKGTNETVDFSATPTAKVYVDGNYKGDTPIKLEIVSKKTTKIEFKADGYTTQTMQLDGSVGGGWIVLDVVCGLLPVIVDAATGNWYELNQSSVKAVLEKEK